MSCFILSPHTVPRGEGCKSRDYGQSKTRPNEAELTSQRRLIRQLDEKSLPNKHPRVRQEAHDFLVGVVGLLVQLVGTESCSTERELRQATTTVNSHFEEENSTGQDYGGPLSEEVRWERSEFIDGQRAEQVSETTTG